MSTYAKLLGENEAESLLRQTLEEEKETDQKLSQLAAKINVEAEESEQDHQGPKKIRRRGLEGRSNNKEQGLTKLGRVRAKADLEAIGH